MAFGTVDDRNIFHLLPRIDGRFVDWKLIRSLDVSKTMPRQDNSILNDDVSKTILTDDVSTRTTKSDDVSANDDLHENVSRQKG